MNEIMNSYNILGVRPTCSDEELKTAYRKLAKQWHPDLNKSPEASNKFKEIQRAFEDISKFRDYRQTYDPFFVINNIINNSWSSYFTSNMFKSNVKIELEFDELSDEDSNRLFDVLTEKGFKIRRSSIIRGNR
jgi:DnaJ-class molecular chaperone